MEESRDPGQVGRVPELAGPLLGEDIQQVSGVPPPLSQRDMSRLTSWGDSTIVGWQLILGGSPQPRVGWQPL